MTILLILNLIKTIHDIQAMERGRQKIEMDERRNQMEAISLQMMQTLSTTIEAKDESVSYTHLTLPTTFTV